MDGILHFVSLDLPLITEIPNVWEREFQNIFCRSLPFFIGLASFNYLYFSLFKQLNPVYSTLLYDWLWQHKNMSKSPSYILKNVILTAFPIIHFTNHVKYWYNYFSYAYTIHVTCHELSLNDILFRPEKEGWGWSLALLSLGRVSTTMYW